MALQAQKLITLQNPTGSPITITWDNVPYTFAPSAKMTLAAGVAASFREKNANLTITAARNGVTLDGVVGADLAITNDSGAAMTLTANGQDYEFDAAEVVVFDASVFEGIEIQHLVTS